MSYRQLTTTILLSLPLYSGQAPDRPSPMPAAARKPVPTPPPKKWSAAPPVRVSAPERPNSLGRTRPAATPPPGDVAADTGQASFYASSMTGRPTASGQPFNNDDLSGAHRSYPLGSMVRVTNLANDKSVVVRIVDRGPYAPGRVINVSQSAAKQLDMLRAGVAEVRLELLPEQAQSLP